MVCSYTIFGLDGSHDGTVWNVCRSSLQFYLSVSWLLHLISCPKYFLYLFCFLFCFIFLAQDRTSIFQAFRDTESGVLLCTVSGFSLFDSSSPSLDSYLITKSCKGCVECLFGLRPSSPLFFRPLCLAPLSNSMTIEEIIKERPKPLCASHVVKNSLLKKKERVAGGKIRIAWEREDYGKARAANGHRCRHLPESKMKKEQRLGLELDATMAGAPLSLPHPRRQTTDSFSPLPPPLNPKHSFILLPRLHCVTFDTGVFFSSF